MSEGRSELGAAVVLRRRELKLTAEDATARSGLARSTWQAIEGRNRQAFRADTLNAVDDTLGWNPGTARSLFAGEVTGDNEVRQRNGAAVRTPSDVVLRQELFNDLADLDRSDLVEVALFVKQRLLTRYREHDE